MELSGGPQPKGTPGNKKCILSLDGGGVRGLISAVILERLESYLPSSQGEDAKIADYFDAIAGTSTGALIACLLVVPDPVTKRPKYSAKDAVNFYMKYSGKIFPPQSECSCSWVLRWLGVLRCLRCLGVLRFLRWLGVLQCLGALRSLIHRLMGPSYSPTPLVERLQKTFGDLKLSDTVKPVIVPSYDIQDETFVQFSTAQVKSNQFPDCFIRDVCRATSAAPTYFAPYYFSATTDDGVKREFNMVDGGICANNPTLIAVSEILRADSHTPENDPPNYDDLLVLSLGTGKTDVSYSAKDAAKWGNLSWVHDAKGNAPIIDMLMKASQDIVDYNLSNTFYEQGSHENYLRVQTSELTGAQTQMDNSSEANLKSLKATATKLLGEPPQMRNRSSNTVRDPRWPTYDAALKQFAQWLVGEKEARLNRVSHRRF